MPKKVLDKALNVLNPFPTEGIDFPGKRENRDEASIFYKRQKLIDQVSRNLVGWTGIGIATRVLLGKPASAVYDKKSKKKLKAYINARNPVISMDPNLEDAKEEEQERELGLGKHAAENPYIEPTTPVADFFSNIKGALKTVGRRDRANIHLAATLSAVFGGFSGGWAIADKLSARKKKLELGAGISKKRNEMDKLMHEEYLRTRGLSQDTPEPDEDDTLTKSAAEPDAAAWNGVSALYTVWAVGSLALAAKTAKKYMDDRDENRARFKELTNIARDRAKIKDPPLLLADSNYTPESTRGALKPKKKKVSKQVALPDSSGKAKTQESIEPQYDERDPIAASLRSAL